MISNIKFKSLEWIIIWNNTASWDSRVPTALHLLLISREQGLHNWNQKGTYRMGSEESHNCAAVLLYPRDAPYTCPDTNIFAFSSIISIYLKWFTSFEWKVNFLLFKKEFLILLLNHLSFLFRISQTNFGSTHLKMIAFKEIKSWRHELFYNWKI